MGRFADAPVLTQPSCGLGFAGCGPHMRALRVCGCCCSAVHLHVDEPTVHWQGSGRQLRFSSSGLLQAL